MQEKSNQSKFMICDKCKKPIKYGRGWAHEVEGDKNYHMDCYLGENTFGKFDLSVANESTE